MAEPSNLNCPRSKAVCSSVGRDGKRLEKAEDVGEPQPDESNALALQRCGERTPVLLLHRNPAWRGATSVGMGALTTHRRTEWARESRVSTSRNTPFTFRLRGRNALLMQECTLNRVPACVAALARPYSLWTADTPRETRETDNGLTGLSTSGSTGRSRRLKLQVQDQDRSHRRGAAHLGLRRFEHRAGPRRQLRLRVAPGACQCRIRSAVATTFSSCARCSNTDMTPHESNTRAACVARLREVRQPRAVVRHRAGVHLLQGRPTPRLAGRRVSRSPGWLLLRCRRR